MSCVHCDPSETVPRFLYLFRGSEPMQVISQGDRKDCPVKIMEHKNGHAFKPWTHDHSHWLERPEDDAG